MVTQIQLGNIFQNNGRTVVGGTQSALDIEAIVNGLTEAKRTPAVQLETKNETIDSQKTAITDLRSILTRFQTAAKTLSNPPGVQNASANIFQYRSATLSTNDGTNAANYLGVTVQPGVATQGFTINRVEQIARETKQSTSDFLLPDATSASAVAAVATPGRFTAGTFSLRVLDGGANASLTLSAGDSLQTIAGKFNDVKDRTGIQATVLKVASGSPNNTYRIVFTGTKTGLTTGFDLGTAGTVPSDPSGVFSSVSFTTNQTALNAKFTLDGVGIERENNGISDAIDGVTFNLKQPTPLTTTLALDIRADTDIAKNAITQFADVYNEFRLFAAKQSELGDDGLPKETAVLANNLTLRSIITSVASEVNRVVGGIASGDPARLADVGIKFEDFAGDESTPLTRNIITIDTEKLTSALQSNFEGVQNLFEYKLTSDNANLSTFKRTNALSISDFTLNFNRTAGTYQATYTDASAVVQTINLDGTVTGTGGLLLKGQNGTVLEGLQLIFSASDNAATINVNISQGIGDRVFNSLDNILNTSDGSLTNAETQLVDQQKRNSDEITNIDEQITEYRDQILAKFTALESALSRANGLLQLLDAQNNARNN